MFLRRSSLLSYLLITWLLTSLLVAGPQWMSVRTGGTVGFQGVWGFDSSNIWAAGYGGYILRWDGKTWTQEATGTTTNLNSIWGTSPDDMWAVGDSGKVLRRDTNGWRTLPALTSLNLSRVWGADSNNVWIVGVGGVILKWNGSSLVVENAGGGNGLGGLWGTDKNNVWVAGGAGTIRKWNGTNWVSQASGTANSLRAIWGTGTDNVWAVGFNNTITKFDGNTWTVQEAGTTDAYYHIWGTDSNNVWVVGHNGVIRKWNGQSWQNEAAPFLLVPNGVWPSDSQNVWVVGYQGTVLKYVTAPTITTVQAARENSTQARFQGSINPNGAPATAFFEYGKTTDYGNTTTVENLANATVALPHSAIATVDPHTTYYYRVVATNAAGTSESAMQQFTLPNGLPVAGNDVIHPVIAGGKITLNVVSNDSDPDGDTLSISAVANPAHGTAVIQGKSIIYTPGVSFDGNDQFTYTINDGFGGSANGTITLQNKLPQPTQDTLYAPLFTEEFTIHVLANDTDEDAADTLSISSVTQGAHGTVAIAGSSISYRPAPNFDGNDTFTYTVSDGIGGTATATVTIANAEPIAGSDTFHVPTAAQLTLLVLANDSDPNESDTLTIRSVENGAFGTVTTDGSAITYTPGPNYNGNDTFFYTVSDGRRGPDAVATTARAQVHLTNTAPVAVPDNAVANGTPVTIDVLGNDSDADTDTPLTITAVTQGDHGDVATNGVTVTYTPAASFRSTDTFSYTLSDGHGGTATGEVVVRLGDIADHVIAGPGTAVPGEAAGIEFDGYGVPSMNAAGKVAFRGIFKAPKRTEGVYFGLPLQRIAKTPETPPGESEANFRAFRDPIVSEGGDCAFLASFSAPKNRSGSGIWIARAGAGLSHIASSGGEAPETSGARFASFEAMTFGVDGALYFTAKLKSGGGVGGNNNLGLWMADNSGVHLIVRKGDSVSVDGTPRDVAGFTALEAVPGSPGQRRGFTSEGELTLRMVLAKGSETMVRRTAGGAFITIASTGDLLTGADGFRVAGLGPNVPGGTGATFFRGTSIAVTGRGRKIPALVRATSAGVKSELLRAGSAVEGGLLKTIEAPVGDGHGGIAFAGALQLQRGSVAASSDSAIWTLDPAGVPHLALRESDPAPGRPGGKFQQFLSLAYPSERGVAFYAKLARAPGAITAANDFGLWAFDRAGELRLVVGDGQTLATDLGEKTIQTITVLPSVLGSPAAGHNGTETGGFVYRVTFTDREQAIVSTWIP